MGIYGMEKIFNPSSIAVVGASTKTGSIGNAILTNLIQGGFAGDIYPINPGHADMMGLKCHASIMDIAKSPDLAVIAAPMPAVHDVIENCVARGVGGAIIISAGGKETGEAGQRIEARIRETAYAGKLRILGPNCLGFICPSRKLNASFAADMPKPGNLAFISQSGAICTAILDMALSNNIGFSHFISMGSMLDADFGDVIDFLGNDYRVKSILLYIENLTNFRKFMSAARSVSRVKPIVVLKSGRSPAGARAAASHTGAMAGEDAVYDAAFKRAGIVRVDTIEELFDCAELMAQQPRPYGSRLAIITNGGGPGVMAADALSRYGVSPAPLDPKLLQELDEILPPCWSRNNPIDLIGDADSERYTAALDICMKGRAFDGALVIFCPQALTDPSPVARKITETFNQRRYPIFASWMGGWRVAEAVGILNAAGIPTYETPERAVRAFIYMAQYNRNMEMLMEIPARLSRDIDYDRSRAMALVEKGLNQGDGFLSEVDSKSILSAYGVPACDTVLARTHEDAVTLSRRIGYPVAMKLVSPDISHKSDAGGVRLDLRSDADVSAAYEGILSRARDYKADARITGVSVQPYIARSDFELLIGAKRDPNFGPIILFGMGGVYTEVFRDRAIGLPPMNRLLARRLMEETRVFTLLKGFRNQPPANMEAMEELIIRLSQLMMDFPEIVELDMNPVIVRDGKPLTLDARMMLKPADQSGFLHLCISPYPAEMEIHDATVEGRSILVRPIKPEDAPLFVQLFHRLSPTSIYYRFFSALKELSPQMLARFTQIDYDREIALVAIDESDEAEVMLGSARIIGDPDGKSAEFSVLVADAWQGKGIGALLLRRCLEIAKRRGMEIVWGTVLQENRNMLKLAKKQGFDIKPGESSGEFTLRIDLRRAEF